MRTLVLQWNWCECEQIFCCVGKHKRRTERERERERPVIREESATFLLHCFFARFVSFRSKSVLQISKRLGFSHLLFDKCGLNSKVIFFLSATCEFWLSFNLYVWRLFFFFETETEYFIKREIGVQQRAEERQKKQGEQKTNLTFSPIH